MNAGIATEAQSAAINTDAESVLALAGPGSGKTATLVARIKARHAGGVPAAEVAVLTFTNAAASELQSRLTVKAHENGDESNPPIDAPLALGFVGTLHSFALRMLKEHGAAIGYGARIALISPEAAADLLASKAKTLGCKTPIRDLLALKAKGRPPRSSRLELPAVVVATYLDEMRASGIVDYDVLLDEFRGMLLDPSEAAVGVQLALQKRFSHLYVDEVQDSAPIDWDIFRALPARWKFLVGDPDQAIYSFRGGRVDEMIAHGRAPGTLVIALEENFRSTEEVCFVAQSLISRNRNRIAKSTISVRGEGGGVYVYAPAINDADEVAKVAGLIAAATGNQILGELDYRPKPEPPSIAVLARTNEIADLFRAGLPTYGVPVVGTTRSKLPPDWPIARAFVELLVDPDNDALAFFFLISVYEKDGATPRDARASAHAQRKLATAQGVSINRLNYQLNLSRIERPENALAALAAQPISRESRAIAADRFRELPAGATTLDLALSLAEVREYVSEEEGDGVRVLTIHGAKGREFDAVFVVGFEDEAIPGRAGKWDAPDDAGIEEERRLAFVAITRARRDVFITSAETRKMKWGGAQKRTPSRFLAELTPEL